MNHLKLLRSISGNNVAVVVQNTKKRTVPTITIKERKKDEQKWKERWNQTRFSRHLYKSVHHTYERMNVYLATRNKRNNIEMIKKKFN